MADKKNEVEKRLREEPAPGMLPDGSLNEVDPSAPPFVPKITKSHLGPDEENNE